MIVSFTVPHDSNLSKNKRYAYYGSKHKNPKHVKAQDDITILAKTALRGYNPKKGKFRVDIIWYRSNMRGDVSNFVNPLLDSIKKCLPFDDNYFTVSADWVKTKRDPELLIKMTFEEET